MKSILVLTNLYTAPDLEKENTAVVHYFAREWIKMGYDVRVIHYPSNFPKIVMWGASPFKNWLSSISGLTVRTYKAGEKEYVMDNVKVKRLPLLKYWPHRAFPMQDLDELNNLLYIKQITFFVFHFCPPLVPLI